MQISTSRHPRFRHLRKSTSFCFDGRRRAGRGLLREFTAVAVLSLYLSGTCVFPLSALCAQTQNRLGKGPVAAPSAPRLAQVNPHAGRSLRSATGNSGGNAAVAGEDADSQAVGHRGPGMGMGFTVAPLDLSHIPTEAELMAMGGMTGPLSPLNNADVNRFKLALCAQLGLRSTAQLDAAPDVATPAMAPAIRVLAQAKALVKRLEAANLDFGRCIEARAERKFPEAAHLMNEHLKQFPDSPWAGEAMLHLSMDATYTGRYAEAQNRFKAMLDATTDDPKDPAWEVRQKAKAGWVNLDIHLGQWNAAVEKLKDILATDTNIHRRTWAASWLLQAKRNARSRTNTMRACGSEALGVMLVGLQQPAAAKRVESLLPAHSDGFSLEELVRIAARNGVRLRGFRIDASDKTAGASASSGRSPAVPARVARLAEMPLPVVVHYDLSRSGNHRFGLRRNGAAWTSTAAAVRSNPPSSAIASSRGSQMPAAGGMAAGEMMEGCNMPLPQSMPAVSTIKGTVAKPSGPSPFAVRAIGHFLVVRAIDLKAGTIVLTDPLRVAPVKMSLADFDLQWSGAGLAADNALPAPAKLAQDGAAAAVSGVPASSDTPYKDGEAGLQLLSAREMSAIRGACCCPWYNNGPSGPPENPGDPPPVNCAGGKCVRCGSPLMSVNVVNMNLNIVDTPLWYKTPVGPDVELTLSYNSQDASYFTSAFGNKWRLNFGSWLYELPGDMFVRTLWSGKTEYYFANANGTGYVSPAGVFDVMTKTGPDSFVITSPTGEKSLYGKPKDTSGTTINLNTLALNETQDRYGNGVKALYTTVTQVIGGVTLTYLLPSQLKDAQNKITTFAYSGVLCTSVTDPFGRQASFTYDGYGNMQSVTDMGGNKFTYQTDTTLSMTGLDTVQGHWGIAQQTPTYNPAGPNYDTSYHTTITDPEGQVQSYDISGQIYDVCHYKDQLSRQTDFVTDDGIDGTPVVTRVVHPDGAAESYTWDHTAKKISSVTDNAGRVTRVTYNTLGRPTSVTNPRGKTTQFFYDPTGVDLESVQDALGHTVVSAAYSNHDPVTVTSDPAGANGVTTLTYTAWGAPDTVTNDDGTVTTYTYDGTTKQLLSVARSATGHTSTTIASLTWDEKNRVRTLSLPGSGLNRTYEYNDLDHPTRVQYSDGSQETTDYVCCALPGVVTDRQGRKTYYDYDRLKRLRRIQDSRGYAVQMDYDAASQMVRLTDAAGSVSRWSYDLQGRVKGKGYADGSYETYAYDAAGNIVAQRLPSAAINTYSYDANDNLLKIDYPTGTDVTLQYDDLDRPTRMTDASGASLYTYDNLGQLLTVDGPLAADTVSYTYDGMGRRATLKVNSTDTRTYSYDWLGHPYQVIAPSGTSTYTYIGNSSLLYKLVRGNATTANYTYDTLQRLTQIQSNFTGNGVISRYRYGFATASNGIPRVSVQKVSGTQPIQTVAYTYDGADQLLSEISNETTPLLKNEFTYDPMGNRLTAKDHGGSTVAGGATVTYTNNRLNQVTGLSRDTNVGGTVTTVATPLVYSGLGGINTIKPADAVNYASYNYDSEDRLISVVWRNRTTSALVSETLFTYDGLNRRTRTADYTWSGTAWVPQTDVKYVYDGMQVVEERDTSTNAVIAKYTWGMGLGGGIGGLLSRTVKDAGGTDHYYYYDYDGSGNVMDITNASQAVVARYDYDAFGNTIRTGLVASDPAVTDATDLLQQNDNPYRFSTKRLHLQSGLYDYGFRFYSPSLGRWINRDPIGEAGGINLFGFVGNNPADCIDRLGLQLALSLSVDVETEAPGLPRGGTYVLRDVETEEESIVRTGRSNDLARRAGEHGRDPRLSRYRFEEDKRTDDYAQQRGREQIVHDKYNPPLNRIRPISPKNPRLDEYIREGSKLSTSPTNNNPCDSDHNNASPGSWWSRFWEWLKPSSPPSFPGDVYA